MRFQNAGRFDCYTSTADIVIVAASCQPCIRLIYVCVRARVYSRNPEVRPVAHSQVCVRARARTSRPAANTRETSITVSYVHVTSGDQLIDVTR